MLEQLEHSFCEMFKPPQQEEKKAMSKETKMQSEKIKKFFVHLDVLIKRAEALAYEMDKIEPDKKNE